MNEQLQPNNRVLAYRNPSTILACLGAVAFLALGLRGILDPMGASGTFGVQITGDGLAFMSTTGARNVGLALLALALIYGDQRKALALLLIAAGGIAALDFWIVLDATGSGKAAKHLGYVVFLLGFGLFLLRQEDRHGS